MRLKHVIMSAVLVLSAICPGGILGARTWEEVDRVPGTTYSLQSVSADSDEEIFTHASEGYVYVVVVRQRTNIKIFTILGQLVIQDTLQPGIYRFKLPARGIYLLKAGSVTKRVTV